VREYGFELALCAHLESPDRLVARQLGGAVHGSRVVDVVCVTPGPGFADRAAITPETVPPAAVESDVGPGRARDPRSAFDCHPETTEEAVERALDCGFFEAEYRGGRRLVRQTTRYPADWFGELVAIENKPDLDRPGDLETQMLTDVHLALFDRVVLATASHVTGAHRNRLPDPVGVWEFDPETGERTVVRAADRLAVDDPGVEILDRQPARAEVRVADAGAKRRARRRVAERAYGKGWRPDPPACARVDPEGGIPRCPYLGRVADPGRDCGPDCDGHDPAEPPDVDRAALRARRTPWEPDPEGRRRRQARLDRYDTDV